MCCCLWGEESDECRLTSSRSGDDVLIAVTPAREFQVATWCWLPCHTSSRSHQQTLWVAWVALYWKISALFWSSSSFRTVWYHVLVLPESMLVFSTWRAELFQVSSLGVRNGICFPKFLPWEKDMTSLLRLSDTAWRLVTSRGVSRPSAAELCFVTPRYDRSDHFGNFRLESSIRVPDCTLQCVGGIIKVTFWISIF